MLIISPLANAINNALRPLGGHSSIVPTETRYIATLKASNGGYIKLAQPIYIGANDDFELVFSYFTSDEFPVSNNRFIAGGDGGSGTPDTFAIYLDKSTGSVSLQIPLANSTSTYVSLTPAAVSNIFNTVTLKRVANNWTLTCGNVTKTVTLAQTLALKITNLAKWDGVAKFNGLYLAFKLWTGGDSSTGQKVVDYDFDAKHGTTIIPNLAQPLGSEVWQNVTPQAYPPTTSTYQNIDEVSLIELSEYALGDVFLVEADIDVIAGRAQILIGNTGRRFDTVGNHRLKYLQKMETSVQLKVRSLESGTEIRINSLSIKKASHWAEYINVTDDNKEQYEWDAERNAWVGVDTGKVLEVAQ